MKTVFVIDDNNVNLLSADETLSAFYRVFTMPSASGLFKLLENVIPDLILMDVMMPDMDGFEALKKLKSNIKYSDIPVIFLTSRNDLEMESRGLKMGVSDFISKPFSRPVMLNRIRNYLHFEDVVCERTESLNRLKDSIISVLVNVVETRGIMTASHIERTAKYIKALLDAMLARGIYSEEINRLDLKLVISAASLHDIGKIIISDLILGKPGNLTQNEYELIKTHVTDGERIIDNIIAESGGGIFLEYAKVFAGYHHERWDGTGYPRNLKGEEIPLLGRIMLVVDVYNALVSDRPYKTAVSHEEAVKIISGGKGTQFDPKIVDVFLEVSDLFRDAGSCK